MQRIVLAAILLTSASLLGQMPPEDAPPTQQTTPGANATTSGPVLSTAPAPSTVAVQQRVLKYDPSHIAPGPVPQEGGRPVKTIPLPCTCCWGVHCSSILRTACDAFTSVTPPCWIR